MPRFYFHLLENNDRLADAEGSELPDAAAAEMRATRHIRDLLSQELRESGAVKLDRTIEIADQQGAITTVAFSNAIRIDR